MSHLSPFIRQASSHSTGYSRAELVYDAIEELDLHKNFEHSAFFENLLLKNGNEALKVCNADRSLILKMDIEYISTN